jgi:hypothetical protein
VNGRPDVPLLGILRPAVGGDDQGFNEVEVCEVGHGQTFFTWRGWNWRMIALANDEEPHLAFRATQNLGVSK